MNLKRACMMVFCLLIMVLAGCDDKPSVDKSSSAAPAGPKKILNVGTNMFSKNLDPHHDYDGWLVVRYGVGETLVRLSDQMIAEPWLATDWEHVDGLTWKITVRPGVKFHNGKNMTAEAVRDSLLRSMEINRRGPSNLNFESIEAQGQTLIIKTKEPRPDLIYELSDPYSVIVDVEAANEDLKSFRHGAVCTGPFKFKEFIDDISVTVSAFTDYWGEPAKLDEAKFFYLNDPDTRMMSLQSGDIDASINIDSSNLALFQNSSKYRVSRHPSMRSTYVIFNTHNKLLADKNLRTALIMAADKKSYIGSVMGGVGVVGVGFYPTLLPYHSEALVYPPHDLEGGRKLLADSGYTDDDGDGFFEKDGKKVELVISSYTSRVEIPGFATALQADFARLGIKTTIKTYDTLPREQFTAGDYEISFTSFSSTTNGRPAQGLQTAFVKDGIENYYNYFYSRELEEIVKKLVVEADVEKQNQLAFEAQQIILDARTNIFLSYTENLYVSSSRVENFNAHTLDYYVLDNQVDIKDF